MKVKKIGVFLGGDKDLLSSMGYQYFLSMTDNSATERSNDLNFDEAHVYSMVCENRRWHKLAASFFYELQ